MNKKEKIRKMQRDQLTKAICAQKAGKRYHQPGARVISMKKAAPDGNQGAAQRKYI